MRQWVNWIAVCGAVCGAAVSAAQSGGGRRLARLRPGPAPVTLPAPDPELEFVPLPDGARVLSANGAGMLTMGEMESMQGGATAGVRHQDTETDYAVQTVIGIRLPTTGNAGGGRMLKAWLSVPADPYRVFIDHVQLSTVPVTVPEPDHADLSRHVLEIRVAKDADPGQEPMKALVLFSVSGN